MKFRKKPVVIEAYQWHENGDHPQDYDHEHGESHRAKNWEGAVVRRYRTPEMTYSSECPECGVAFRHHGWIDTKEGGHRVCPGDWIIAGVKGERYPCKPDIFELTYEPAEDAIA